jgi:dipeptidyl aminopeptidase/acylaminoacyl peptidase
MEEAGGYAVNPHWLADGSRFWYEDTRFSTEAASTGRRQPVHTTIYLVDPDTDTVTELFDAVRVRQALRDAGVAEPEVGGVPFRDFEFVGLEETAVRFELEGRKFEMDLRTYDLQPAAPEANDAEPMPGRCGAEGADSQVPSPDGRWVTCVVDHDVWMVSTETGQEEAITDGGPEEYAWRVGADPDPLATAWSPDGSHLLLQRQDSRHLPRVPIVGWLTDPIEVSWFTDDSREKPRVELWVLETEGRRLRQVGLGEPTPWWIGVVGWRPDGSEVVYEPATRNGLQEDLWALDPATGLTRLIHSESSDAPVLVDLAYYGQVAGTLLSDGNRLLYVSEDSGSLQLYLKHLDGGPAVQLTPGPYPVIRIVDVDEGEGWVYYTALGDPDRPHDVHLFRVQLNGNRASRLTDLGANHGATRMFRLFFRGRVSIHLSPSREYFIARRSTPEHPPVMELRRTDGTLVRVLAEARVGPVAEEYRWRPPEEFSVKAADGVTDLWGVMWKPYDFDPGRRYPVIEVFYDEMVPRGFDPSPHSEYAEQFAQLGFVTVMLEGRGASGGRGRAFRNAFQGQPGGFIDDHATALRNLAREHTYLDLSRVGAFGYSSQGDDVLWALVSAPEIYGAGVAIAPAFNDIGPDIPENLLTEVPNLEGHLFLIHGMADRGALLPPTMRFIDACIRADKPLDLLLVPEGRHGLGHAWDYSMDRARDFFLEHLDPYGEGGASGSASIPDGRSEAGSKYSAKGHGE